MTVGQDMYGTRLDRKNIPPPLSLASFNYPSLSLQQHHIPLNNSVPKSAPPQSNNTDLMQQLQLHFMLQNESKTPAPQLQSQFSTPGSLQSQFSTPSSLPSHSNFPGSNLPMYNSPMSPLMPMSMDSPVSMMGSVVDYQNQQNQQNQQDGKNNASRYKTELCRPFEESGSCKYGEKCQFAHGLNELRNLSRHPKYKTELCRTFHTIGFCPYGPRCHFIHNTEEKRAPPISPGPHNSGNATLQTLPALLSLFQQSSNVNKVMGLLSKMQLQLGGKTPDEVLHYLNLNSANLMTPPNTPQHMFNFPEYIVPAAHALNQATRPTSAVNNTSNIHSYFNFNLALKDSHLSGLLSAANLHSPGVMYPPHNNSSPAGTPPLQVQGPLSTGTLSNESSPMSDKSGEMAPPHFVQHMQQYGEMRGYHDNKIYHQGTAGDVKLSTEYMIPGRVIQSEDRGEYTTANGKRLPIFNQLSDPVC
ncbi:hypothetical protein ACHWQZ_G003274 [Mnemiopsis leidyi]